MKYSKVNKGIEERNLMKAWRTLEAITYPLLINHNCQNKKLRIINKAPTTEPPGIGNAKQQSTLREVK